MNKRIYTLCMVLMLLLSLTACKKEETVTTPDTSQVTEEAQIEISDEAIRTAVQVILETDKDSFSEQELSSITELDVECTEKTDLSELKLLKNLSYLSLSGNSSIDWEILGEIQGLEYLYLQDMALTSLDVLPEMPIIRVLSLENTNLTSLVGIDGFVTLEELYIAGSEITDADSYKYFLNTLNACDIEVAEVEEISEIVFVDAQMEEEVRNAILNFTKPITQEEMDMVEVMILTNPEICSVDDLVQCKNLKSLVLLNTQITNLLPMLKMDKLERVIIHTDEEVDYSVLEEKESIKNLCVNDVWIKGSK